MLNGESMDEKIARILEEYGPGFDVIYGDGVADGMAKGRDDAKLDVARNFLARGFSEEIVSDCTGISIDKLRKIKRTL